MGELSFVYRQDKAIPVCPSRFSWDLTTTPHKPPACGEIIITRFCPVWALCENRVTRLCTVVIGTAEHCFLPQCSLSEFLPGFL